MRNHYERRVAEADRTGKEGETMIVVSAFQDCVASSAFERRQFQRLQVPVQTELRGEEIQAPIRIETADISLGGCYVEMAFTLDIGTALNLVLWLGHEKLNIGGRVVSRHPQFGNGIEFTGLSNDFRQRLGRFLEGGGATPEAGKHYSTERLLLT